jgi:hypothetical protein
MAGSSIGRGPRERLQGREEAKPSLSRASEWAEGPNAADLSQNGYGQTAIKIYNDPEIQTNTTPKYNKLQH